MSLGSERSSIWAYTHTKDMYNYYDYDINDIKRRGANQDSHSNNVIVNIAVKFTQIS